jgi:peptide/nickel transport system substrate-binding protein
MRTFYGLIMVRFLPSVSILIFLIAVLPACEGPHTPSARQKPRNENVLRYDVPAPFTSLDPTQEELSGSTIIFPLLYSYLFVPNSNGKLEPDLARKWTYDPKTFTWTIYLREDARFHNKQPVTSRDVDYSFKTVLKNNVPSLFSWIGHISFLSDTALQIRLNKHDPQFPEKIWDVEIIPIADTGRIDYFKQPIGSGPFRFKAREGNQEVVLVANEDYFDGRPSLDRVVFYFQPDKEKAWTRLLSGETDIAQEISPKNFEIMQQYEKEYYFDLYPLHWYTILLYNTSGPLFSDPRVRRALSHAFDRTYIVGNILMGFGEAAVGPMGLASPFHNPAVKAATYAPKKTLRLLKEVGWSDGHAGHYLTKDGTPFEFTLLVFQESQIEKKVAQYVQLCLNDLGIKAHLQLVPFLELKGKYGRNTGFQAVLTEFGGVYRNPEFIGSLWTPSLSKRSEAGSFEDPELTRLIRQALDETDPVRQKELFHDIDALITSLQPGTFLFHKTAIDVMSKRFRIPFPFSLTHEGIWRLRHASLDPHYS